MGRMIGGIETAARCHKPNDWIRPALPSDGGQGEPNGYSSQEGNGLSGDIEVLGNLHYYA